MKEIKQPASSNTSFKLDRSAMEKKRRMQMKDLLSSLASLIPAHPYKQRLASPTLVDQATGYIKQLKEDVEELKRRKEELIKDDDQNSIKNNTEGSRLPVLAVRDTGTTLEVNLITGLNKNFMLREILSILEDEGTATVVSASYSTVGDKIFYTIYSEAIWSRIGMETSRVLERLEKLVF
ncbi:hypothetical protein F0562_033325 [Nyssa sinensis]|uniref:BHLH domain-containing protein n=1 Tax=Nyssa sinensis TaxID=561372 RepID=A0A5J5ATW7_9ASTE|nr:hypothetical protein F0562_033325 [Nyssa sinensis]